MQFSLNPGSCDELGAVAHVDGVNFALFSDHAVRVELVLYDSQGQHELARADLPARDGDIWHGFAPGLKPGLSYGYRVHGPYAPERGHLFNPAKLLLDPYAKGLAGTFEWGPEHFGYVLENGNPDGPVDMRDNAHAMVKGRILDPKAISPMWPGPRIPWQNTLICELHAKGFTMRDPDLSAEERGVFGGLGSDKALDYLKSLGVTAIELLPVHAIVHDKFLIDQGLRNYWGYNTLNFFSPHPGYARHNPIAEMRGLVQRAHDAGLEVLMDVVYNHTCEGNRAGPTLSFRGIDNASYYRVDPLHKGRYNDITGCGATMDACQPIVRRLIRDSLVHWVTAYGIDGFRFDIATQLGTDPSGHFSKDAPLFKEIAAEPLLAHTKLIAEPWDASGGYQVGQFPPPFADWNDRARNAYRQFWRGDQDKARDFATALSGSADRFRSAGKPLYASVNFVSCHDGFPLADVVRYNHKHNHANGEDNRDGGNHDHSCNHGVEGASQNPALEALRDQQARNMLASALLSFGTPMLLAGDEFGRTQGGNNNAYAQDNMVSWLDWSLANSKTGQSRITFTRRVIALRKEMHGGLSGAAPNGPGEQEPTIAWWSVWGGLMSHSDWMNVHTQCFGALIEPGGWLLLFNASEQAARFVLPPSEGGAWRQRLDSADPLRPDGEIIASSGDPIGLDARSLRVFQRDLTRNRGQSGHGY
jgi:isoamylase